jgi:putative ABC transport system ATP-binding protein
MTLSVRGISVRFGSVLAVRGASLTLRPGELVAVTGPSGAGKSSLLTVVAGLYAPAEGTIELDGSPLADRDDAVARGVVLIPQGNALLRVLTALENVAVPLVAVRPRIADARARAEQALRSVGLADAGGQLLEELSGGQQQRVAVARGLAEQGKYVLADEPTSELDAANRARVMALLRAEAARGAGVLVATHDPAAADACDAELHLSDGVLTVVRAGLTGRP